MDSNSRKRPLESAYRMCPWRCRGRRMIRPPDLSFGFYASPRSSRSALRFPPRLRMVVAHQLDRRGVRFHLGRILAARDHRGHRVVL